MKKTLSIAVAMVTAISWFGSRYQDSDTSNSGSDTPQQLVEQKQEKEAESKTPEPVDITKKVVSNNDRSKFAGPPVKFRKGHVNPIEGELPKAVSKDGGFEIQLPSGAPIPTVTFYNGRLYTSGGFHSKQFYCFDANSGAVIWAINLDDDGPSSAVCEEGVCVFNTESCTIFAVDASTGTHKWSWWLGDPLMSTPTICNGRVFTSYPASGRYEGDGTTGQGGAFNNQAANQSTDNLLDSQTEQSQQVESEQNKEQDQSDNTAAAKVRTDGLKPPSGQTHVMACFDLQTGKILWQRWIDSDVMSAPIADGNELYATSFGGTVYRFDQKTGKVLSAVQSRATSAPTIVDGKLNFSRRIDGDNETARESLGWFDSRIRGTGVEYNQQQADYLEAQVQQLSELKEKSQLLDAENGFGGGAPQQANPDAALDNIGQNNVSSLQAFQGSRGLYNGGFSYCCPGDKIICNDTTGKELWSLKLEGDMKKMGGMLAAPPIYAGGQILVSTLSGEVMQIDAKKGKVLSKHKIGQPLRFPPIVDEGRIYVGTQAGKLVCVDTGDKSLTGWTTWGGNSMHNKTD